MQAKKVRKYPGLRSRPFLAPLEPAPAQVGPSAYLIRIGRYLPMMTISTQKSTYFANFTCDWLIEQELAAVGSWGMRSRLDILSWSSRYLCSRRGSVAIKWEVRAILSSCTCFTSLNRLTDWYQSINQTWTNERNRKCEIFFSRGDLHVFRLLGPIRILCRCRIQNPDVHTILS